MYWGGWIGLHNRKRKSLQGESGSGQITGTRLAMGLALLGFVFIPKRSTLRHQAANKRNNYPLQILMQLQRSPDLDRLYLAVPERGGNDAELRLYHPQ